MKGCLFTIHSLFQIASGTILEPCLRTKLLPLLGGSKRPTVWDHVVSIQKAEVDKNNRNSGLGKLPGPRESIRHLVAGISRNSEFKPCAARSSYGSLMDGFANGRVACLPPFSFLGRFRRDLASSRLLIQLVIVSFCLNENNSRTPIYMTVGSNVKVWRSVRQLLWRKPPSRQLVAHFRVTDK